jgi:hypothetical protein
MSRQITITDETNTHLFGRGITCHDCTCQIDPPCSGCVDCETCNPCWACGEEHDAPKGDNCPKEES